MSNHETRLIPRNGNPLGRRYEAHCLTCNRKLHLGEITYEAAKDVAAEHVNSAAVAAVVAGGGSK